MKIKLPDNWKEIAGIPSLTEASSDETTIHINVKIKSKKLSSEKMKKLHELLRSETLKFLFDSVDKINDGDHKSVDIHGNVNMEDGSVTTVNIIHN